MSRQNVLVECRRLRAALNMYRRTPGLTVFLNMIHGNVVVADVPILFGLGVMLRQMIRLYAKNVWEAQRNVPDI